MSERLLRWTAIGIAILAFIDPEVKLAGSARSRLSVATSGGGDAATVVRRSIHDALGREFEIVDGFDGSADALIVIGDRYPDEKVDERTKVSTVTVGQGDRARVALRRIAAPREVPATTAIRLGIDVSGEAVRGVTSSLSIRSRGAQLARRTHVWSSDSETWHEDLDVVPVGEPPFIFDVRADDSGATVAVDVARRLRVLVFDGRPSWTSAFVRRALEEDRRFDVTSISVASPGKLVTTGPARSLPADPRAFDAIILGGLERLSPAEIAMVERFTAERGGGLVLLPDTALPANLAGRFGPIGTLRETLVERPVELETVGAPRLSASELLEAADVPAGADVIAWSPSTHRPIVWTVPSGDGLVLVSGALDAWRYRGGDDRAFDRFWRSVISSVALMARPPIEVTLSPRNAAPGERVSVRARVRRFERHEQGERLAIGARAGSEPLRLWPGASPGTFIGSFAAERRPDSATQLVTVTLPDGSAGTARLVVDARQSARSGVPLSWLARSRGGLDVDPSGLGKLEDFLQRTVKGTSVAATRHPMRSPWWIVPFAACLSAEWWLRRRRGAR